jgi:hypothetical protein
MRCLLLLLLCNAVHASWSSLRLAAGNLIKEKEPSLRREVRQLASCIALQLGYNVIAQS